MLSMTKKKIKNFRFTKFWPRQNLKIWCRPTKFRRDRNADAHRYCYCPECFADAVKGGGEVGEKSK